MKNIMILGKNGQVGDALQRALGNELQYHAFDSKEADLADEKKIRKLIQDLKPEIIVNAAAYTAVDHAESDEGSAFKINARGPQIIGEEATSIGAPIIHFSSDYVFDGKNASSYKETDLKNPLSVYGASKLQGEKLLLQSCPESIILRTSWVASDHGNNFLKTMLKLAHERDTLGIVSDQVGVPTSAHLLANVTQMFIKKLRMEGKTNFPFGIYHVAPHGKTNWYEYARFVIEEAIALGDTFRVTPDMIHSIKTQDYPTPAKRPLNSILDTSFFEKTFSTTLPPWEEGVFAIIKSLYKG